jgi:hypothetical protein
MNRLVTGLLAMVLLLALGCGGEKDHGINSGKDMPRSAGGAE